MNPIKQTRPFIEANLNTFGIEWGNKGRVSDDFKFLVYGKPNYGKQIGLYGRKDTVIRLEKYDQNISGVEKLDKCAKSHAAESDYSNFKNHKGDCVMVDNTMALTKLLEWYFQ
mgnify:CR=1 FL=1